jgi:hypothetical protein
MLLNLAAALRIAEWERAGLRSSLPADLPTASAAIRSALSPETADTANGSAATATDLSARVLRTWLEMFSYASRESLDTDVLMPVKSVAADELLESLADFLWTNHNLGASRSTNHAD